MEADRVPGLPMDPEVVGSGSKTPAESRGKTAEGAGLGVDAAESGGAAVTGRAPSEELEHMVSQLHSSTTLSIASAGIRGGVGTVLVQGGEVQLRRAAKSFLRV